MTALTGQQASEMLDKGAFPGAGHTGDAYADRIAGVWEAGVDNGLGHLIMLVQVAFNQGDRLAQHHAVMGENAVHIGLRGQKGGPFQRTLLQIGVHLCGLGNAVLHMQR